MRFFILLFLVCFVYFVICGKVTMAGQVTNRLRYRLMGASAFSFVISIFVGLPAYGLYSLIRSVFM